MQRPTSPEGLENWLGERLKIKDIWMRLPVDETLYSTGAIAGGWKMSEMQKHFV